MSKCYHRVRWSVHRLVGAGNPSQTDIFGVGFSLPLSLTTVVIADACLRKRNRIMPITACRSASAPSVFCVQAGYQPTPAGYS